MNVPRQDVETPVKVSAEAISVARTIPFVAGHRRESRRCLSSGSDFQEYRLCPSAKGRRVQPPMGTRILPWLGRERSRARASRASRMLRLSGMISQYFFTAAICPMHRAVRLWLVFPVPADVRDMSESHDHPAAVFACRRFAQVPRSQAARSSRVRLP